MSEDQLSALLAQLKEDGELQEKFKGAADLDAAVALAREAGFDVSRVDWLQHQSNPLGIDVNDEDLENLAGGLSAMELGPVILSQSTCWRGC